MVPETFPQPTDVLAPFAYADLLVQHQVIGSDRRDEAAAIIMTTPTSLHLREGSKLLVDKILHGGSDVILWTQGDPEMQRAKTSTSTLLEMGQAAHGTISALCESDKIESLGKVITKESLEGKNRLVFVDDKAEQLLRAYQSILKLKEVDHIPIPHDIEYVWMRVDPHTSHKLPEGFVSKEKLADFMDGRLADVADISGIPVYAQTLYFLDFDRTLFDLPRWLRVVQDRIASELSQR
ncbi:hypothetical protein HYS00_04595 [Candidatus Microgenomates bacterium]|nr:hypothetical protein [Candidatus Microgenomates bacterium]